MSSAGKPPHSCGTEVNVRKCTRQHKAPGSTSKGHREPAAWDTKVNKPLGRGRVVSEEEKTRMAVMAFSPEDFYDMASCLGDEAFDRKITNTSLLPRILSGTTPRGVLWYLGELYEECQ